MHAVRGVSRQWRWVTGWDDDLDMRDDPAVVELVERARGGDPAAWSAIVDRYAALVHGICRRYGLTGADADDVGGSVWLRLVQHLELIREPAALPGWLASTTRRECLQALRRTRHHLPVDEQHDLDDAGPPVDEALLAEERRQALRLAFADLQERCQRLLELLFTEPPVAYTEVSRVLDMPVGAIGPNRKRCLERLRRSRALAGFGYVAAGAGTDEG